MQLPIFYFFSFLAILCNQLILSFWFALVKFLFSCHLSSITVLYNSVLLWAMPGTYFFLLVILEILFNLYNLSHFLGTCLSNTK